MLQGEYGKGIAHYIQDIAGQGFDLIPNPNQNGKLKAPSMWGFFSFTNTFGIKYSIQLSHIATHA